MSTPAVEELQKAARRPFWLWIAGVYYLLGGLLQLAAIIQAFTEYAAFESGVPMPWQFQAFGYAFAMTRIAAGILLLLRYSRAVLACGLLAGGSMLGLLSAPMMQESLLTTPQATSGGQFILFGFELLSTCWIWWAACRWQARGVLGRSGAQAGVVRATTHESNAAVTFILTMTLAHMTASVMYLPLLLEKVRIGLLNTASALLVLSATTLLLVGGILLFRGSRLARHALLAAAVSCVLLLRLDQQLLAPLGVILAVSGFFVAVSRQR